MEISGVQESNAKTDQFLTFSEKMKNEEITGCCIGPFNLIFV